MIGTKKYFLSLIFIFSFSHLLIAQNSEADLIIGTWLMPENEGKIKIFKDGENYNGTIVWMLAKEKDGTNLKDKENPVDSLKTRDVVGLQVMSGFKYKGDKLWSGGTFYAAKKGKEVEPDFILIDKNKLKIKISIFLFSFNIELTRVEPENNLQKE